MIEDLIKFAIVAGIIWNMIRKARKARKAPSGEPPGPPSPPPPRPAPEEVEEGPDLGIDDLRRWFPNLPDLEPEPEPVPPPRPAPSPPPRRHRPERDLPRVAAAREAPRTARACPSRRVLGERPDLRRAVVWSEILAPPLALRRDTRP